MCWAGDPPSYLWNGTVGPAGLGVASTSIGYQHACALRQDQMVLCWGARDLSALGLDSARIAKPDYTRPRDYGSFRTTLAVEGGHRFVAVSAGGLHSCAIEAGTGAAYCWGANQHGQLGIGAVDDADSRAVRGSHRRPTAVVGGERFLAIAAGLEHTCAVRAVRDVFCWGRAGRGATGRADAENRGVPQAVSLGR
jgi:alpha-tubulin suppressor-like RCC1 family protein